MARVKLRYIMGCLRLKICYWEKVVLQFFTKALCCEYYSKVKN